MKRAKIICGLATIMIVAVMSLLTMSCSKDVIPELKIPTGSEDFFTKSMDFDSYAGEKKLTFSSNVSWTASVSGSTWLSVTPTSGEKGTNTLIVKAEENTTYDDRNAVITLTAGDSIRRVFVNQKQLDALTLTSDRFEVPAEGGEVKIEVKANINYEAVIPNEYQGWIHRATSATRGLTTSTLTFKIDKSEEYDKREGKIIIKANGKEETVNIYQTGGGIIVLTQNEYNISSLAQELAIEISSNFDFEVNLPNVDWISKITSPTRGLSTHTLRFAIAENESYDPRSAKITIFDKNSSTSDEVTIIQAQKDAMLIDKKEYVVYEDGGSLSINVNTNIDYAISINCDWIKENNASTRGLEKKTSTFIVSAMSDNTSREGTITFLNEATGISESVVVKQVKALSLESSSFDILEGSQKSVSLTNNTNQNIKWTSSNSSVAAVDNNGLVKGLSLGKAIITAKTADGKYSCQCEVSVKDITAFINAKGTAGVVFSSNDHISYGSRISWTFFNNSSEKVHINTLQLIDGKTGEEGNLMSLDTDVEASSSVGFTTLIGLLGINSPVTGRFRYEFKGKEYIADGVFALSNPF